ncbi:hypothetical protein [Micromonospora eburnea]|uniref:Uncharacterized protein n=1 Tax=Micromonospora eburnea TaxID=227316 RepID=A0A1C6UF41_9ACTN|nr:hypothetical protein [Micromonospora eburnea]SCL52656.1 hypothetical protein GA0070604_2610 [Micromonospora eburnea]
MAIVRVRLRGGPYDGVAVSWDVPDADDPPMTYDLKLHGPHEATENVEYHRVEQAPDGAAEWIYAVPGAAAG